MVAAGALAAVGAAEDDCPGGATVCGAHAATRSPLPATVVAFRKSRLRIRSAPPQNQIQAARALSVSPRSTGPAAAPTYGVRGAGCIVYVRRARQPAPTRGQLRLPNAKLTGTGVWVTAPVGMSLPVLWL